jgi:hypothetical protein
MENVLFLVVGHAGSRLAPTGAGWWSKGHASDNAAAVRVRKCRRLKG